MAPDRGSLEEEIYLAGTSNNAMLVGGVQTLEPRLFLHVLDGRHSKKCKRDFHQLMDKQMPDDVAQVGLSCWASHTGSEAITFRNATFYCGHQNSCRHKQTEQ